MFGFYKKMGFFFFSLCCFSFYIKASNPLKDMNYDVAFSSKIYSKYKNLLLKEKTYENVFAKKETGAISDISEQEEKDIAKQLDKDLLKQLSRERRRTILLPAKHALYSFGFLGGAVGSVCWMAPDNEFVPGIIFYGLLAGASYFKDIVSSFHLLRETPHYEIDDIERKYLLNQRFIPRALWEKSIHQFILLRQETTPQKEIVEYLNFVSDMKIFAPERRINIDHDYKRKISDNINRFFKDYESFNVDALNRMKVNIFNYCNRVLGNEGAQSDPIILESEDLSVGKTFFVEKLFSWFEEFFGKDTIIFSRGVVSSENELDGNEKIPSLFLKTLRYIKSQGEGNGSVPRGAVLFIEDANWLKKNEYRATLRNVLHKMPRVNASYLKEGMELLMPPTLLIMSREGCLLDEIKDENENGFLSTLNIVPYPYPTHETLLKYALKGMDAQVDFYDGCGVSLEKWPHKIAKTARNFMDVRIAICSLSFMFWDENNKNKDKSDSNRKSFREKVEHLLDTNSPRNRASIANKRLLKKSLYHSKKNSNMTTLVREEKDKSDGEIDVKKLNLGMITFSEADIENQKYDDSGSESSSKK